MKKGKEFPVMLMEQTNIGLTIYTYITFLYITNTVALTGYSNVSSVNTFLSKVVLYNEQCTVKSL
jgi:hypothetical protein